jgi:hypothetical protein
MERQGKALVPAIPILLCSEAEYLKWVYLKARLTARFVRINRMIADGQAICSTYMGVKRPTARASARSNRIAASLPAICMNFHGPSGIARPQP